MVLITLNPYQGLKQADTVNKPRRFGRSNYSESLSGIETHPNREIRIGKIAQVLITLNPYQGLKR